MGSRLVLFCGGQEGSSPQACFQVLGQLLALRKLDGLLIHGGHAHADSARQWAQNNGVDHVVYALNVRRHGENAWKVLNRLVIEHGQPHGVVALDGGRHRDHLLNLAVRAGIPIWMPYGNRDPSKKAG